PSLTRPEPMFDLAVLDRTLTRSELVRFRLADERRLFRMVAGRARRRVVLVASDDRPDTDELPRPTRFAEALRARCAPGPGPGAGRQGSQQADRGRREGGDPEGAQRHPRGARRALAGAGVHFQGGLGGLPDDRRTEDAPELVEQLREGRVARGRAPFRIPLR